MGIKQIDMSRDTEQLSEMVSHYDPEYPIGFFLDPRMVEELGLQNAEADQEFNIVGCIKVKSITETSDKKEIYASVKSLGVVGKANQSPIEKMSESYSGAKDDKRQD